MKPPIEFRASRVSPGRAASGSASTTGNGSGPTIKKKAATGPAESSHSQKSDPTDAPIYTNADGVTFQVPELLAKLEAKRLAHNAYHQQYRADAKLAKAAGLSVKAWRERNKG